MLKAAAVTGVADWVLGKQAIFYRALSGTLVAAKTDGSFFERIAGERRKWDAMLDKQADPKRSRDRIHPMAVARAVSDWNVGEMKA